jgi:hypothetical protein
MQMTSGMNVYVSSRIMTRQPNRKSLLKLQTARKNAEQQEETKDCPSPFERATERSDENVKIQNSTILIPARLGSGKVLVLLVPPTFTSRALSGR